MIDAQQEPDPTPSPTSGQQEPDTATVRGLAVEADADPRSVRKEIRAPGSVRGLAGHRIRKVLARHGYEARCSAGTSGFRRGEREGAAA